MKPAVAVDTSVVVAGLLAWHEHHDLARRALATALEDGTLILPVPTLVESFRGLSEFFEPQVEIAAFTPAEGIVERAAALLSNEPARAAMGRRARQRALREHTWDRRVESFVLDIQRFRPAPAARDVR